MVYQSQMQTVTAIGEIVFALLICFDHAWTWNFYCIRNMSHKCPLFLVGQGCLEWSPSENMGNFDEFNWTNYCMFSLGILLNHTFHNYTINHGLNPVFRLDQCFCHLLLSLLTQLQHLPFNFSNALVVGKIWWVALDDTCMGGGMQLDLLCL